MQGIFTEFFANNGKPKENLDFALILTAWKSKNYYEILGLDRNSDQTSDQINKATRQLYMSYMRVFHIDKFISHPQKQHVEELNKLVLEARSVLGNRNQKLIYDSELQTPGTTYASTFGGAKPPEKKARPDASSSFFGAEKHWQNFIESASEQAALQFLINNPDKVNLSFHSTVLKQEVTPLVYACTLALRSNPMNLRPVKQLLLNGARIPYLRGNEAQLLADTFNAMIGRSDGLDLYQSKLLSEEELSSLIDNNINFIDYLKTEALTILLYVFAYNVDMPMVELLTDKLGNISRLKPVILRNGNREWDVIDAIVSNAKEDIPVSKLLELFRFLQSKNVSFSIRDYFDTPIRRDKLNIVQALLCAGAFYCTMHYFYKPNDVEDNVVLKFLESLPPRLLMFYSYLKDISLCLDWKHEETSQLLAKVIQTCCAKRVATVDDLNEELIPFMIDAVFSFLRSLSNKDIHVLPSLIENLKIKLFFNGITTYLKPTPITASLATLCLRNKKPGDYLVSYDDNISDYTLTYIDPAGKPQSISSRQYLNKVEKDLPIHHSLAISLEELYAFRTETNETVLHCVAKAIPLNNGTNTALSELLASEQLARNIINARDKGNRTALYYAAQNLGNEEVCKKMVLSGADTSVFFVSNYLIAPFDRIPYVQTLINLQSNGTQGRALPNKARLHLQEIRSRLLQQAEGDSFTDRLNRAILDGQQALNALMNTLGSLVIPFRYANSLSLTCAILSEHPSIVRSLLYHGLAITPTAFKLAILTENQELISLVIENCHPAHWPNDYNLVLESCSKGTIHLVQNLTEKVRAKADKNESALDGILTEVISNHSEPALSKSGLS